MVYLSNGIISAAISETGAEIKSLKKDSYEYIWSGDPRVWANTAPFLFPIVCKLKDDKYLLNGKTYEMGKHGFVRNKPFVVESASEVSVTMLYTENEETLKMYPYNFEFRAIYTLDGSSLKVEYRVNNTNNCDMYFSVGAHEAYATPEGIEDYDLIFPNKENLETTLLNGALLTKNTMTIGKNTEYLPLYEKYFILDTLIFKTLKSRSVMLKNRKTDRALTVEFPDCDYLGIWHKPSAGYICIEPWAGIADNEDTDYDFTKKEGIIKLDAHKVYSNIHTITV